MKDGEIRQLLEKITSQREAYRDLMQVLIIIFVISILIINTFIKYHILKEDIQGPYDHHHHHQNGGIQTISL